MKRKLISIALVTALVMVSFVGASLAYFQDQETVTNTFTMGDVDILLQEEVPDGQGSTTVKGNGTTTNYGKVLPNQTETKRPFITVKGSSAASWVAAKVSVNHTEAFINAGYYTAWDTFKALFEGYVADHLDAPNATLTQVMINGAEAEGYEVFSSYSPAAGEKAKIFIGVDINGDVYDYYFIYESPITPVGGVNVELDNLFEKVHMPKELTREGTALITETDPLKIEVTAYAIQKAGFSEDPYAILGEVAGKADALSNDREVASASTASDLLSALNANKVVSLSDDVDLGNTTIVTTGNSVLNLNGHTIKSSGWVAQVSGSGNQLVITGDGTIESTGNCAVAASDGATIIIDSGSVKAQEAGVMAFDGSEVIVNGGTFETVDNFVVGTNGSTGRGKNTITINGGVFNGNITSNGYVACGIYVANNDTVVVNGGTFNIHNGVGILARSGNTTVNEGVVINVTSDGTITSGKIGDSTVDITIPKYIVKDERAGYPGGAPTVTNNTSYEVFLITNP